MRKKPSYWMANRIEGGEYKRSKNLSGVFFGIVDKDFLFRQLNFSFLDKSIDGGFADV